MNNVVHNFSLVNKDKALLSAISKGERNDMLYSGFELSTLGKKDFEERIVVKKVDEITASIKETIKTFKPEEKEEVLNILKRVEDVKDDILKNALLSSILSLYVKSEKSKENFIVIAREGGGEGEGEHVELIVQSTSTGYFYRSTAEYYSYDGIDYWTDWELVEPKLVERIIFHVVR